MMRYITGLFILFFASKTYACNEVDLCPKLKELGIKIEILDTLEKAAYQCSLLLIKAPEYQREKTLNNFQIHMRMQNPEDNKNYLTTFVATSFNSTTNMHSGAICINPNLKHNVNLNILYTNKNESEQNPVSVTANNLQLLVKAHNKALQIDR